MIVFHFAPAQSWPTTVLPAPTPQPPFQSVLLPLQEAAPHAIAFLLPLLVIDGPYQPRLLIFRPFSSCHQTGAARFDDGPQAARHLRSFLTARLLGLVKHLRHPALLLALRPAFRPDLRSPWPIRALPTLNVRSFRPRLCSGPFRAPYLEAAVQFYFPASEYALWPVFLARLGCRAARSNVARWPMPRPLLRAGAASRLLQLRVPWWTSALRPRIGTQLKYALSTVVLRTGVHDPPLASVGTTTTLLRVSGFHQFHDIAPPAWPAASVEPTDCSAVQ